MMEKSEKNVLGTFLVSRIVLTAIVGALHPPVFHFLMTIQRTVSVAILTACCVVLCVSHSAAQEETRPPRPLRVNGTADAIDLTSGEWDNVVNIAVSVLYPDFKEPWNAGQPSGGSGTGFLIGPNRFWGTAQSIHL
jgi:hypothetical protein